MGFVKEFKEFAMRGNVLDLAVGVVIGGAFNNIVTKLVDAVIMPLIGIFTPGVEKFDDFKLGPIKIGLVIHSVFDFVIIAFALFLMVKAINRLKAKTVQEAPAPTKSEILLTEIRDALKK
jgi:large conductance mechanosensitive channel